MADLQRFTRNHSKLQCFDLGFALDTFRMVALTSNFRKLQSDTVVKACQRWVAPGPGPGPSLLPRAPSQSLPAYTQASPLV